MGKPPLFRLHLHCELGSLRRVSTSTNGVAGVAWLSGSEYVPTGFRRVCAQCSEGMQLLQQHYYLCTCAHLAIASTGTWAGKSQPSLVL